MDKNVGVKETEGKKKVNLLFRNMKKGKPVGRFAERIHYYDYNLIAVVILLTCFGLIMLYSTSSYIAGVKEISMKPQRQREQKSDKNRID